MAKTVTTTTVQKAKGKRSSSRRNTPIVTKTVTRQRTKTPNRRTAFGNASKSVRQRVSVVNGTPAAKLIAAAMALPGSCPNLRIKATAGESQPSAATNLHRYSTVRQPTNSGTYASMPVGTSSVVLFRDPLRAVVQFVANSAAYSYDVLIVDQAGATSSTFTPPRVQGQVYDIEPLYLKASTANAPHGTYLYCGEAAQRNYFWVDHNATVTLTRSVDTDGIADRLRVFFWEGDEQELTTIAFAAAPALTAVFTNSYARGGYYRFAFESTAAAPAAKTLTMALAGNGDVFAHLSVPNADKHLAQFTKARINAASIMTTPTAALINRGGTITGGSFEGASMWYENLSTDIITSLPSVNFDVKDYKVGMYTFLKPSDIDELSYHNYTTIANGNCMHASFPLDTDFRYTIIILISEVSSGTSPGEEFLLSLNWDIEYQTSDLWLETHLCSQSYFQFVEAIEILSHVKLFHENPLHFDEILQSVRGGYNWVRKNVVNAGRLIHNIIDTGTVPARTVGDAFLAMPEWN